VSQPKRRLLSFLLTVLGCGVPIGVLLWITFTNDLHYNVYSSDSNEVWYKEYFPTYFNVIVTAVLSPVLGLIAAAVIRIAPYLRRSSNE
jgi:Na+/phosphate symporter